MAIIFGGDAGIREDSFGDFLNGMTTEFNKVKDGLNQLTSLSALSNLGEPLPKENVYVDDGFQNVPGTAFVGEGASSGLQSIDDVKTRRITTQAPQLTVYIKKRVFWSLRNEHDSKFMDAGEKLFYRATKALFEKKCAQIAAYEGLTKLGTLVEEESELDFAVIEQVADAMDSLIVSAEEEVEARAQVEFGASIVELQKALQDLKEGSASFNVQVEKIRELGQKARQTKAATGTTWVVDTQDTSDVDNTGRGTGVIELTLVDSINTSLSLNYGDLGTISLSVENPYNLLTITDNEIEIAVKSAFRDLLDVPASAQISTDTQRNFLGPQAILERARREEEKLRTARNTRFNLSDPNSSLSSGNRAEIIFEINPTSSAPDKVTGSISAITEPFNRNNFRIVFAQLDPIEQLTLEEDQLMIEVFNSLQDYVTTIQRLSETDVEFDPKDTNVPYARRQMRLSYLGKPIIQPMDGIHIYIRGNTFKDGEVIGPLNAIINNTQFIRSFAKNQEVSDAVIQEEMRQFGVDDIIPVDLYKLMRTGSLLRNAGMHVFGGLISTVTESYNANQGKYTLSVSGESNMKWLDLSNVNTTPSLDQTQGVLEDPLTPLDLKIDEATGFILGDPQLSNENRLRIRNNLYFNSGDHSGEKVDELTNLIQDFVSIGDSDVAFAKRKHAPGLIYKWKQGIIVATREINLRTALTGDSSELSRIRREVGITVTANPFANLDIADVISLLVTGVPHNYESFFTNAASVGTFVPGGGNNPESFFHSFFDITRSTNRALGNFQPFKDYQISREQMAKRLALQTDLTRDNNEIKKLNSEIARDRDLLNQSPPGSPGLIDLTAKIQDKENKLIELSDAFTQSIADNSDTGLRVYDDDIVFDESRDTSAADSDAVSKGGKDAKLRSKLMQFRPQLSVKLNTDTNLFIVSDDYDKDLDLQAFAINLASGEIPIWNSQFRHPKDICLEAAKVFDLEFFCDTQGNIRLRTPKYNKLPLSLLVKMIVLTEQKQSGIAPPFFSNFFQSRRESLEQEAKVLDLDIKILNLLLFGVVGRVSNEASPADTNPIATFLFTPFELVTDDPLELASIVDAIQSFRNQKATLIGTRSVADTGKEIEKISEEINQLNDPSVVNSSTNRVTTFNRLLQKVGQRQRVGDVLEKLKNTETQNANEGTARSPNRSFGTTLNSGDIAEITEPFGDLIEDDFNDFLGPGSASRYIIFDDQIIDYQFTESDKNVNCRVDVTGLEDLIGESPGEIGGVPLIWAGATDFDLWKQYGWRSQDAVTKPFFKSGELQCAPYALMLLTRQRRDVVRATITLVGNEYYQLGDVVYINSRDMLYYVYGVSHSFSYSSGAYTTKLDLRYGHPLGEFIPTPLDAIGKNLIKNQREFNTSFTLRDTAVPEAGRCVGVIVFPNLSENFTSGSVLKEMVEGDIGAANLKELKNALLRINFQKDSRIFNKVILRSFKTDIEPILDESLVQERLQTVKDWFTNPIAGFVSSSEAASGFGSEGDPISLNQKDFPPLNRDQIQIDPIINLSDLGEDNQEAIKGKTPKEEVYNVSTGGNPVGSVEISIEFDQEVC